MPFSTITYILQTSIAENALIVFKETLTDQVLLKDDKINYPVIMDTALFYNRLRIIRILITHMKSNHLALDYSNWIVLAFKQRQYPIMETLMQSQPFKPAQAFSSLADKIRFAYYLAKNNHRDCFLKLMENKQMKAIIENPKHIQLSIYKESILKKPSPSALKNAPIMIQ